MQRGRDPGPEHHLAGSRLTTRMNTDRESDEDTDGEWKIKGSGHGGFLVGAAVVTRVALMVRDGETISSPVQEIYFLLR